MDLGHKGKTVIISGGSKGIGAGISEVFAQEGANLVINYHRNKESCLEFAGTCQNAMESEQQLFRVMWERKKM